MLCDCLLLCQLCFAGTHMLNDHRISAGVCPVHELQGPMDALHWFTIQIEANTGAEGWCTYQRGLSDDLTYSE